MQGRVERTQFRRERKKRKKKTTRERANRGVNEEEGEQWRRSGQREWRRGRGEKDG